MADLPNGEPETRLKEGEGQTIWYDLRGLDGAHRERRPPDTILGALGESRFALWNTSA